MELINEIRKKLYEELGVSNSVTDAAKDILNRIINKVNLNPNTENYIINDSILYGFEDTQILVTYNLFIVDNESDIDKLTLTNPTSDILTQIGTTKIYELNTSIIYIKSLNKYIDDHGSLQHELEHIYQMIKSGKHLLTNDNSSDLYEKSEELRHSNNIYNKIVGYVIYYNCKFERNAFVNQTYKEIMDNPKKNPYETLKNTVVYSNINVIKEMVLDTDIYKKYYQDIVFINFNKGYKWFYNMANKVVKQYINDMGKAFAKAKQDLNKTNNKKLDGDIFSVDQTIK